MQGLHWSTQTQDLPRLPVETTARALASLQLQLVSLDCPNSVLVALVEGSTAVDLVSRNLDLVARPCLYMREHCLASLFVLKVLKETTAEVAGERCCLDQN